MKKEQVLVQEIHNAFDNAEDVLLEQAHEIIESNHITDTSHITKMVEAGFRNAKIVEETNQRLKVAVKNAEMAELIVYYKRTYPFLKFLTIEKLDEICEKYDLIHGPVDRYLEDVPEKNLNDVLSAQELKEEDIAKDIWKITSVEFYSDVPQEMKDWILYTEFEERPGTDDWFNRYSPVAHSGYVYSSINREKIERESSLFIAAPKSHFNLKGLKKHGKLGFFKSMVIHETKDPIVFRYVRGGIQVLTKWGLEANDPELANPLDN